MCQTQVCAHNPSSERMLLKVGFEMEFSWPR